MPYDRFDELRHETVAVGSARIEVSIVPDAAPERRAILLAWVQNSARAITTYFGRFPVEHLRLLFVQVPGKAIHGTTWGVRGAATRITLGEEASDEDVLRSWVLTHELVHVAMPQLARDHIWLEEGLATYVEPVARAQAGLVSAEYVWGHFLWGMPQGLPKGGDKGLDQTHSWGRTYWGGALFCLLSDIAIRMQTGNRMGLEHSLQAINAEGGNTEMFWPIERFLHVADRADGAPIMYELYEQQKATPVETDLAELWRRLGIATREGHIVFDDAAPLAAIRRAITKAPDAHR